MTEEELEVGTTVQAPVLLFMLAYLVLLRMERALAAFLVADHESEGGQARRPEASDPSCPAR